MPVDVCGANIYWNTRCRSFAAKSIHQLREDGEGSMSGSESDEEDVEGGGRRNTSDRRRPEWDGAGAVVSAATPKSGERLRRISKTARRQRETSTPSCLETV